MQSTINYLGMNPYFRFKYDNVYHSCVENDLERLCEQLSVYYPSH